MMNTGKAEPVLLCIETSGEFCSVALSRGDQVLSEHESDGRFDHSAMLVPHIQTVLERAGADIQELDAVALSSGPGSYTGLRVGTSTAKAICYATGCHLLAVDTLEAIAMTAVMEGESAEMYFPVVDARRMEVYIAAFDAWGNRLLHNMALEVFEDTFTPLISAGERIAICGPSAGKCAEILGHQTADFRPFAMHARYLTGPALRRYFSGQVTDNVAFTPQYVKAPNITKSTKPLF